MAKKTQLIPKIQPIRDKSYCNWLRRRGGNCCICEALGKGGVPADEPHHFLNFGMGKKGPDTWQALVCRMHHNEVAGKHRKWFERQGMLHLWVAMLEDAMRLRDEYQHLIDRHP